MLYHWDTLEGDLLFYKDEVAQRLFAQDICAFDAAAAM
jgi:hypothetical protein